MTVPGPFPLLTGVFAPSLQHKWVFTLGPTGCVGVDGVWRRTRIAPVLHSSTVNRAVFILTRSQNLLNFYWALKSERKLLIFPAVLSVLNFNW